MQDGIHGENNEIAWEILFFRKKLEQVFQIRVKLFHFPYGYE